MHPSCLIGHRVLPRASRAVRHRTRPALAAAGNQGAQHSVCERFHARKVPRVRLTRVSDRVAMPAPLAAALRLSGLAASYTSVPHIKDRCVAQRAPFQVQPSTRAPTLPTGAPKLKVQERSGRWLENHEALEQRRIARNAAKQAAERAVALREDAEWDEWWRCHRWPGPGPVPDLSVPFIPAISQQALTQPRSPCFQRVHQSARNGGSDGLGA